MDERAALLYRFGVALAIGALIGLEREKSVRKRPTPDSHLDTPPDTLTRGAAGLRTYTLVSLLGAVSVHLGQRSSPWVVVAALLSVCALLVASYHQTADPSRPGITSEVSCVLAFTLGGLCAMDETVLAGGLAVVITGILSLKNASQGLARRLRREDMHAVLTFASLWLVVLPLLPTEPLALTAWAPDDAPLPAWLDIHLDLRKAWILVILVSAISFAGFVIGQFLDARRGLFALAIVGGLASSTALTLSFSQRSTRHPHLAPRLAAGILLANAIMPLRVWILCSLFAPSLFLPLARPMLCVLGVAAATTLVLAIYSRHHEPNLEPVELSNPFELKPALTFGALFALILVVAQVVEHLFRETGTYALAAISGFTDVDAVGLAVADLVANDRQSPHTGAVALTLAVFSNTLLKGYFVLTLGSPQLRRVGSLALGLVLAAALAGAAWAWQLTP